MPSFATFMITLEWKACICLMTQSCFTQFCFMGHEFPLCEGRKVKRFLRGEKSHRLQRDEACFQELERFALSAGHSKRDFTKKYPLSAKEGTQTRRTLFKSIVQFLLEKGPCNPTPYRTWDKENGNGYCHYCNINNNTIPFSIGSHHHSPPFFNFLFLYF